MAAWANEVKLSSVQHLNHLRHFSVLIAFSPSPCTNVNFILSFFCILSLFHSSTSALSWTCPRSPFVWSTRMAFTTWRSFLWGQSNCLQWHLHTITLLYYISDPLCSNKTLGLLSTLCFEFCRGGFPLKATFLILIQYYFTCMLPQLTGSNKNHL